MIVSWNELQRTCQKAFRGLGMPAGADDDASFAVLWLQARGLDALTPLDAALSALEHTAPRPLELRLGGGKDGVDVLDAGGQPAVAIASDALDYAVARAVERGARTDVLLAGVEGAIFVAGTLAQRPVPGPSGRVEWRDGEIRHGLEVASDGARRISAAPLDLGRSSLGVVRQEVRIVIDRPDWNQWMESGPSWQGDVSNAELERRAAYSVTHGIEVPNPLWTRLLAFARRTLVPASEASRRRGAGGGTDDG